ncbi:hypothetical protein D9613_010076 [Agrocybe pediades]|uniref:P-loop containing nucleoside triphosphate hydrolase protein n=1 Tax=Agrocybe pediades TaxID=84607 RepID=A0A8H4QYE2_9AGAR|nr:hypothetical protein D9613_010076 [Agrocybe pediades]
MFSWDLRLLPLVLALVSICLLALKVGVRVIRVLFAGNGIWYPSLKERFRDRLHQHNAHSFIGFTLVRITSVLVLAYLSSNTAKQGCDLIAAFCIQHISGAVFLYCVPLLFLSVLWAPAAVHANLILLTTLGIYVFRNLWPLATYDQEPADTFEGRLMWIKLMLLFIVGLVIPLITPRRFVPVDNESARTSPSPEQTSSWASKLTYTYIDPIIATAYKVPHLQVDQLPPLADVNHAKYQCNTAFPYLDIYTGAKRCHLFWGLLYHFRMEYLTLSASLIAAGVTSFAAPFAIKQLLTYIETGGENASVKPWFWILLLLLGPLTNSIFQHWDGYLQNIILVRIQALLTQLVFNHSLRIRLKADIPTNVPDRSNLNAATQTAVQAVSTDILEPDVDISHPAAETIISSNTLEEVISETNDSGEGTSQSALSSRDKDSEVSKSKGAENLTGKINNLVTSDISSVGQGDDFVSLFFYMPLQIGLSIFFLYKILGWSALVGLLTLIGVSPIPGWIAKRNQDLEKVKMQKTDARVQIISEIISVIRMVKLFGWEEKTLKMVNEKREDELKYLLKTKIFRLLIHALSGFVPTLAMLFTYATYTVIMKQDLTASKIFSSMAVFTIMRNQLNSVSYKLNVFISAKVALDRINQFLQEAETLDRYANGQDDIGPFSLPTNSNEATSDTIGFCKAAFSWSTPTVAGEPTPDRHYTLKISDELSFKPGCINMIVGPTGSGKTSILMALLGEMHFMPLGPDSWYHLPCREGVAYAAQESWVQNATIRENILFGSIYDETRYRAVIQQCALERDLELFEAGDQTEARVTLARAIYSSAQIILLDDVLAALDAHTSSWIVNKCLRGDLTHNVALVGPIASFVVSVGNDGTIKAQGTEVTTVVDQDAQLNLQKQQNEQFLDQDRKSEEQPAHAQSGKLVLAEEIIEGRVSWKTLNLLISALGGKHPIMFFSLLLLGLTGSRLAYIAETWFLGVWGAQYEIHAPSEVSLSFYVGIFASIIFAAIIFDTVVNVVFFARTIVAARVIHSQLADSVFKATFRWLDETPTARVIARCTQDVRTVDGPLAHSMCFAMDQFLEVAIRLAVIMLVSPLFVIPGAVVGFFGAIVGILYLKAQLSMKREMSNSRSPILAHVNASVHGLVSVRAYGAQNMFKEELIRHIDHYSRISRMSGDLNRWVGLRTDFLGAIFTALLAFYQVYLQDISASNTGFSLNMAVSFCISIFWSIQLYNDFEVESNSLERIQSYLEIEHEPKSADAGKPPAYWPGSGDLVVQNLSARYSQSGPNVLHDLSFRIRSGERVGIVGRTGSGKSSLALSLLRCIVTEGNIIYDGIDTETFNLDALRSSITIIPQVPELMSGTLRQNLDPFDQYDDASLNDALKSAGLFSLQEGMDGNRLVLDSPISAGGNNLSVGQRQIIALARAMMRGSKLLIFDEATSAIDYQTDAVIQETLRTRLSPDTTVLTIAHRLQTVMDADKIMVLDNGRIVEFDSPRVLLQKDNGAFRLLVEESGTAVPS